MSFETIFILAVLAFLGWLVWHVIRAARAGTLVLPDEHESAPEWWPFSDGMWRGANRSMPLSLPMIMVFIALGWSFNRASPGSALYDWLLGLGSLTFLAWMGLSWSITLFNRPRLLVPREMRSQLGVLAERRRRRRAARAARRAR